MKLLHVRLPCKKIYPGGSIYLADYLHKGTNAEQRMIDLAIVNKKDRLNFLNSEIYSFRPDIIAFSWRDIQIFSPDHGDNSLRNAFNFYYSRNPISKLKSAIAGIQSILDYRFRIDENISYINHVAKNFKSRVIVGGPAVSVFAHHVINRLEDGILGVIGEGEDVLVKVLHGFENSKLLDERVIFKNNSQIFTGEKKRFVKIENHDAIDYGYINNIFPQFNEYKDEFVGVQTKRGCGHRCMYCIYPHIDGNRVRCRPKEAISSEISQLYHNYGINKIWFIDSQFIPSKFHVPRCIETLDAIIKEKVDIGWGGYIRIENMNKPLAEKMLQSGISQFELSIASGSQRIVDFLTLDFKIKDVLQACDMIKKAGYDRQHILLNFSLNAPTETKESLLESISVYNKIKDIFRSDFVRPIIFFLGIQPHTRLEKFAIEQGRLTKNYNPLSLNPLSIRKFIYNPAPLDKVISRACLNSWNKDNNNVGISVMKELEEVLK